MKDDWAFCLSINVWTLGFTLVFEQVSMVARATS